MSVSSNPPYVNEEPNFCMVCGSVMLSRTEIVIYDMKTGDPRTEDVYYCGIWKDHGESRLYPKADPEEESANPIMDSIKDFFARLFGGLR